ncbi:MAG: DUF1127 domain-containing protein [Paracoccaceae bacterium]|mgnify:FL=1|nr:hypothetical protein RB2150_16779 [Rhodobacterales bacterium HTCC2150] [Rhodobacteraceae bacterium HTCC2150]MDG1530827.1 DUF1127 domain-containing protein [Paracoccaceae bacterium]
MTYVNLTQTQNGFLANLMETLSSTFAKIGQDMIKKRMYRITVQELSALSGKDLADLGINRAEIHSIAYKGAYGAE